MESTLNRINNWCSNNNIPIYRGKLAKENYPCEWIHNPSLDEDTLTSFLSFLDSIKPKFIILDYDSFEYYPLAESVKNVKDQLIETDSNELQLRFEELIKLLKSKEGQLYFIEISFIENGHGFSHTVFAEWSDEFVEFNEIIDQYRREERLFDRHLVSDNIIDLAKDLARDELFVKAKNKAQREIAATLYLKKQKLSKELLYNIDKIIEYADGIIKLGLV